MDHQPHGERADDVFELRQYLLHPGRRDELIDVFDHHLVETQEAAGMCVVGQYRDLDRPDHFVWIRSFPDMGRRVRALTAFYEGPVWARHGGAAAATMIDSDDVLLLRPIIRPDVPARPSNGASCDESALLTAVALHLDEPVGEASVTWFRAAVLAAAASSGARLVGAFAREYADNDFPRLPVRDDHSLVALLSHPVPGSGPDGSRRLTELDWSADRAAPRLAQQPEVRRLAPTRRSRRLVGASR